MLFPIYYLLFSETVSDIITINLLSLHLELLEALAFTANKIIPCHAFKDTAASEQK